MSSERQKWLLVALGLLVVVLLVRYVPWTGGEESLGPARSTGTSAAGASDSSDAVAELALGSLSRVSHSAPVGRDPWRFYEPPPPPPPPQHQPTKAELERDRLALEQAAREAAERDRLAREEAARPKPPKFSFKYLGSFGPKNRPLAAFSDGKTIINAHEGEVILSKFRVAKIGYESVDIKYIEFPDEPALRLAIGR
ncbi:MAG TPA: hypothetical protein VGS22_04030 [Thermoanaerobaculia bacterium]|jgi:hypothetical protein|nr:hypothetical protein [Thermoanaerobaculia bacterium]